MSIELLGYNSSLSPYEKFWYYVLMCGRGKSLGGYILDIVNWEDSVENFFAWSKEWCGVEIGSDTYDLMILLIKTDNDLEQFVNMFDGDIDHLETTLYRMISKAA